MPLNRSKGLEWDVAIVGSPDIRSANVDPVVRVLLPHTRRHYVAFSRARRLLVLSAYESPRRGSIPFGARQGAGRS